MPLTANLQATCTEIWHSICDKAATAVKKTGSHTKQLTPKLLILTGEETAACSPQVTISKEPQNGRNPDSSRELSTGAGLPEARTPTGGKTDRGAKSFTTAGHSQEREPSKRRLFSSNTDHRRKGHWSPIRANNAKETKPHRSNGSRMKVQM